MIAFQKALVIEENNVELIRTDFETMKEILNFPFTKKEILSCKDKLKNSKASGIDMIKNEVLKTCLDAKSF